jgi:multifunctional methyltransferase subunit TRM112
VKGLKESEGYPLRIEATQVEVFTAEYNVELVKNVVKKIKIAGLQSACRDLNIGTLIHTIEDFCLLECNEALYRELHHLLFEYHVQDGALVCPHSGRSFPVKEGIPNMLLHEDEV